jgi:ribosomal protein S18 acetylase RimI-like enzyme
MKNTDNVTVRLATYDDLPFLIQSVIEADKSGTAVSSYCSLLHVDEVTFAKLLEKIFLLELDGFEFCVSAFCVLESNGVVVGASASWIENSDGIPSWQNRVLSLREVCDLPTFSNFLKMAEKSKNINPERTIGALQIESVFIINDFRGKGLLKKMLDFHQKIAIHKSQNVNTVELLVYDNNSSALKSYLREGFQLAKRTKIASEELKKIFPSDGMILLSKKI